MTMNTIISPKQEQSVEHLSNAIIETVSHELRTPLNIMMGYASLLQDGALGDLTPEQQHAMSSIVTRADDMRDLVSRLNILMEAEAGLGQGVILSLVDLVTEVVAYRKEDAEQVGVSIHLNTSENLPPIAGDQAQLREMADSLLDNAIKFTPRGGEIQINYYADEEYLYLNVEDTGIGIAEDNLDDIFTSFRRFEKSEKTPSGGLGMGLSIVRAVAKKHGGDAYVKSRLGEGSRFTVKFPLASVASAESAKGASSAPRRILIVDDDAGVSFTLQNILDRLPNCEITVANSGAEALQHFSQGSYDLVFTDYKMPEMNGLELTKAINAIDSKTMVIVITAHSNLAAQVEAEKLDVHSYLKKPLDIKEIRQTAKDALETNEEA